MLSRIHGAMLGPSSIAKRRCFVCVCGGVWQSMHMHTYMYYLHWSLNAVLRCVSFAVRSCWQRALRYARWRLYGVLNDNMTKDGPNKPSSGPPTICRCAFKCVCTRGFGLRNGKTSESCFWPASKRGIEQYRGAEEPIQKSGWHANPPCRILLPTHLTAKSSTRLGGRVAAAQCVLITCYVWDVRLPSLPADRII